MKHIRKLLVILCVASACVVSGCATTSHDSSTGVSGGGGFVRTQPSPTADMTPIGKVGYYAGWYALVGLYAWAGGNVPEVPPQ